MTKPSILANECWKKVLGYEGTYEVSNLGRIRRVWTRGYKYLKPSVNLSKGGRQESVGVHILIAEAFRGGELDRSASPRITPNEAQPRVDAWDAVFGESNACKPEIEPEPEPETDTKPTEEPQS